MNDELPDKNNYVLGDQLARGGMGSVIVAEDQKLEREVALKVMAFDAFSDDALRQRFVREAKVLAKLAHPNIVPIYDIVWEDGNPQFYTMKLVQGHTLQEILDGLRKGDAGVFGAYSLNHLLTVFCKVCDAMAFAHSQGVVHRDLKPANVMVGEFGEVLVMDWGLAGIEGDDVPVFQLQDGKTDKEGSLNLTMNGVVMGTPLYMSPEQAQGRVDEIDAQSDIYSLGGILYTILTLRPPVNGSSLREVVGKISDGKIDPPSAIIQKAPSGRNKSGTLSHCPGGRIPRRLSAVVMKALELQRSQRYQTVAALEEDVVAFKTGHSTSADELGAIGQLFLLMKRHKAVTASLAAILLLSIGFMFKLMATAKSERLAADSERRTAYSAMLAQALNARVNHDLGQARRLLMAIDPTLRGFDWRLLHSLCRGDELSSFRLGDTAGSAPHCLALVPGKNEMAIITADGKLHRRTLDGEEIAPPRDLPTTIAGQGDLQRFDGLVFSPSGERLAYSVGDTMQVIDARTFGVLFKASSRLPQFDWLDDDRLLYGFNGSVSTPPYPEPGAWIVNFREPAGALSTTPFPRMCGPLAVSADRKFYVLHQVNTAPTSWKRTLHIFGSERTNELPYPKAIYEMPGREYPGNLALSASGNFLAFSCGTTLKRIVRVLEVSTGEVVFDHEFHFPFHDLVFDPEERRLGLVGDDSVVRLYDFTRGNPVGPDTNTYDDDMEPALCQQVDGRGAHSPPRDLLTRSAQDGRAWFFYGHESRVLDVVYDSQGTLFTSGGDGTVRRWPRTPSRPALRIGFQETAYDLSHPAASADGEHILYQVGNVWLSGRDSDRFVALYHRPLAVLKDGRPVTQNEVSGDVVIWKKEDDQFIEERIISGRVPFSHDGKTRGGALSRDETRMAGVLAGRLFSADLEGGTIAWSGDLGKSASPFASHAISPDGEWIASSDFGAQISIHRFAEPEKIVTWLKDAPRDSDTAMVFSRDGRLLYAGNEDGQVRVWETETWNLLPELGWPAHLSAITAMAVSHDQSLIATSGDETLKLFPAQPQSPDSPRREHLSFQIDQSANWIQFARDDNGSDRALLHSVPGRTLEVWKTDSYHREQTLPIDERLAPLVKNHAAILLSNGQVLIAGGETHRASFPCIPLSACYLYDPEYDTWSQTGAMRTARTREHQLHLQHDGKVLVVGGTGTAGKSGVALRSAELYDPTSGNWSAIEMSRLSDQLAIVPELANSIAITLPNGKVLVAGGYRDGRNVAGSKLYDPETETWQDTGPLPEPSNNFTTSLLRNGKVLITGGYRNSVIAPSATCALFDLSTRTWEASRNLQQARAGHSATQLNDVRILVVGGSNREGVILGMEWLVP